MPPAMIRWNQLDTVLLDMDGTLLDLHYDNYFWLEHVPRRFSEKHGLSAMCRLLFNFSEFSFVD